jgi:hypothetical protein
VNTFLIGAGFNIDAGTHKFSNGNVCRYPLVNDVARLCFNLTTSDIPKGRSIEDLFADAQDTHNSGPMNCLAESLMDADHYLAGALCQSINSTYYSDFFDRFAASHFLTFNYDSLIEIMLFNKKRWFPEDGYGVPVQTELTSEDSLPSDRKSESKVLHLHGSLCLNFTEFDTQENSVDDTVWLDQSAPTRFMFDPGCLANDFAPYERARPGLQYLPTDSRVIAPVPNKGPLLVQKFIQVIYEGARTLISQSETLVSIGYSFNYHDKASYEPILRVLAESRNGRLIVVSPDAREVSLKLEQYYPGLRIYAISKTFKDWAADSFNY